MPNVVGLTHSSVGSKGNIHDIPHVVGLTLSKSAAK